VTVIHIMAVLAAAHAFFGLCLFWPEIRVWVRQRLCRHNFWISDYLPVTDERGRRFVLDRCSHCGKQEVGK
jgi:hypothetical protein